MPLAHICMAVDLRKTKDVMLQFPLNPEYFRKKVSNRKRPPLPPITSIGALAVRSKPSLGAYIYDVRSGLGKGGPQKADEGDKMS